MSNIIHFETYLKLSRIKNEVKLTLIKQRNFESKKRVLWSLRTEFDEKLQCIRRSPVFK